MLTELTIENFAIIDRLRVHLEPGFTVLTGETGAGKSIIIDALQAALGAKVPADMVRSDASSASVETIFELDPAEAEALAGLPGEYGINEDGCLILRREISAGGRSTGRLNGRTVPVAALAAIGATLVDIHGQSEHLSILKPDRQLDVLDRYGQLPELRSNVSDAVKEYARSRRDLDEISSGAREAEQRLDLLRFQLREIDAAQLRRDEEEELQSERNLLTNAERLTKHAAQAHDALRGDGATALDGVATAAAAVRELASIDPALKHLSERLDAAQIELEDVAQELRQYRDRIEFDPRRLEVIEERLDLLTRLKRKYGSTVEEVIDFARTAHEEIETVENLDERLAELQRAVEDAAVTAGDRASELSQARAEAAARLTDAMAEALQGLGLAATSFRVELSQVESADGLELPDGQCYAYSPSGVDVVSFLVSFNPGEPLRPLERAASGGETSRFLLALKSVLAGADRTPTLVFDEVDVGVGGRRAIDLGQRMRSLARSHQVLTVTHMPQIAALADHHLSVSKAVQGGRTTVDVQAIEGGERVAELAEMMSGTGSEVARRNAEELLQAAQRSR